MNKLLKDAIADAKAVRETALANAKVALEEAFAPKLQSMLSHKIKEEMEETEGEEVETEEDQMEVAKMKKMAGIMSEEDDEMAEEEPMEEPADEEGEDMESEEDYSTEEDDMEEPAEEEEVSDEDLEEILRELDAESEEEEMENEDVEQPHSDDRNWGEKNMAGIKDDVDETEDPESAMDEEIDLEEIIAALREEDETEEEAEPSKSEEDLEEAYGVIKFLRSKLNEVNLLNAKLLFVNKLFRKGELSESQKVKIIETFDRAKNVREAKLIYATLSEAVGTSKAAKPAPKKRMNEGLASAPQKKTQIITESNNVYSRFKTLVDYNGNK